MSSAGLKPSAAITRGMTDRQAAIVNSRWLRHSAAGVSAAATALTRALTEPLSQETCGGHSRKPRSGATVPVPSGALPSSRRWLVPRSVTDFPSPCT